MRVDELEGAELDYWVARASGWKNYPTDSIEAGTVWHLDAARAPFGPVMDVRHWTPSTDWRQGGPIIERERIQLSPPTSPVHRCGGPNAGPGQSGVWSACTWRRGADGRRAIGHDDKSPLVAAMRCFVRSKFGDEVNPE